MSKYNFILTEAEEDTDIDDVDETQINTETEEQNQSKDNTNDLDDQDQEPDNGKDPIKAKGNDKVTTLWNSINRDAQDILIKSSNGNLNPQEPNKYFRDGEQLKYIKWQEALDNTSNIKAEDSLLTLYTFTEYKTWNVPRYDYIEPWIDIMCKLLKEIGIKLENNAFLKFLKTFYSVGADIKFTKDDVILINNLWSDNSISKNDLAGTGIEKTNHIIFNTYLWKTSLSIDDKTKYIQIYFNYSSSNSWSNINFDFAKKIIPLFKADNDSDVFKSCLDENGSLKQDDNSISLARNILIFVNGTNKDLRDSPLNSLERINSIIESNETHLDRNKKKNNVSTNKVISDINKILRDKNLRANFIDNIFDIADGDQQFATAIADLAKSLNTLGKK